MCYRMYIKLTVLNNIRVSTLLVLIQEMLNTNCNKSFHCVHYISFITLNSLLFLLFHTQTGVG